jgi:predicted amidohydrolase
MDPITVAALSPSITPGDVEANLASAYHGLQAAKAQGVELALFSEWYLTHALDKDCYRVAQPVPEGPAAQAVIGWAQELKMTIAIGIEELDPDRGVVYNTHFLAGPTGYLGKHRKTHLMVREWGFHRQGDAMDVFDIGKARVGVNICHENMYPENSRVLALKGAEIVLAPFGCGGSPEPIRQDQWINDYHMACWRARCFDNGIFMIVAGGNGYPGNTYKTYACIIDPWADVIAAVESEPADPEINLVVATLDPERYIQRRTDTNYPIKKRRTELYGALVERY